jgi:hypothetical protein
MKALRTIARVLAIATLAIGLGAAVTDSFAAGGNSGWPPGGPGTGNGGP